MLTLSRLSALSLAAILLATSTPAHGDANASSDAKPAKSISLKAAQKMYRDYAKATAASMAKTPFKMMEEYRSDGKLLELDSITVDRRGNGREVADGVTTLLLVSNKMYFPPRVVNTGFAEFELEIARDLGYQVDKNWSTVSGLDPKVLRSALRSAAAPDTTLLNDLDPDLAKSTWQPSAKHPNTGTLVVDQPRQEMLASEVGFDFTIPASSIRVAIKSGKVTSITEKDENRTVITRFENYTKLISKPSGPILDYDRVLLDDRYASGWARENAITLLRQAGREAAALAAFDGNGSVSNENWDKALQGNDAIRRTTNGLEVRVIYPGYPLSKIDQEFIFCASDPTAWTLFPNIRPPVPELQQGPCPGP